MTKKSKCSWKWGRSAALRIAEQRVGERTRPRVPFPAPSPETGSGSRQSLIRGGKVPAFGVPGPRGRAPEHAGARVLPGASRQLEPAFDFLVMRPPAAAVAVLHCGPAVPPLAMRAA